MKKSILIFALLASCFMLRAQDIIVLDSQTLMHEVRDTEAPLNGATVSQNPPVLMWPDPTMSHRGVALDGMEEVKAPKREKVSYRVWLCSDANFGKGTIEADCKWAFFKPDKLLRSGKWFWKYSYTLEGKAAVNSPVYSFTVAADAAPFATPNVSLFLKNIPKAHPRVLLMPDEWDGFIASNATSKQREWYIKKADEVLKQKISSIDDTNTSALAGLDNAVKRKAYLTRESRRIVDREEINIEALTRAYLLTKDKRYADNAVARITEMLSWSDSPNLVGDFNNSVVLSVATMAYDSFYDILSAEQRAMLLGAIKSVGADFYRHYAANLENLLADNHVWQMTLRILTMASVATYGELPEADEWMTYCYSVWCARFPGLNNDGAWHNGDSYFHVNLRTLIEVPDLYSRYTGFDFFSDPWYKGSANYVIYNQPPFSKSGGNGSSHKNVLTPPATRMLYAEALARMTGNSYAADYVRVIEQQSPELRRKALFNKPGDLTWFLMRCDKPLPEGKGLKDLPLAYVFPQSGLALFESDWNDYRKNAMVSFRSSPYGSTSHAIANQNAFNTFYGGKSLFYSSGHHTSFVDQHAIYCHRGTRAHNTILVDGIGQRIGTEGYGWIPRHYVGKGISYVLGDASNAYGEVTSDLWKERARLSDVHFTPENGWDKSSLKRFRRHMITLGDASLAVVIDELVADSAATWSYMLHSVENPLQVLPTDASSAHIRATNSADGVSDAYIFASSPVTTDTTSKFFYPAENWLRADDKGNFPKYDNHWHATIKSEPKESYCFVSVISTHNNKSGGIVPVKKADGVISVGDWTVNYGYAPSGELKFSVSDSSGALMLNYDTKTTITEGGKKVVLVDSLPELEI